MQERIKKATEDEDAQVLRWMQRLRQIASRESHLVHETTRGPFLVNQCEHCGKWIDIDEFTCDDEYCLAVEDAIFTGRSDKDPSGHYKPFAQLSNTQKAMAIAGFSVRS